MGGSSSGVKLSVQTLDFFFVPRNMLADTIIRRDINALGLHGHLCLFELIDLLAHEVHLLELLSDCGKVSVECFTWRALSTVSPNSSRKWTGSEPLRLGMTTYVDAPSRQLDQPHFQTLHGSARAARSGADLVRWAPCRGERCTWWAG